LDALHASGVWWEEKRIAKGMEYTIHFDGPDYLEKLESFLNLLRGDAEALNRWDAAFVKSLVDTGHVSNPDLPTTFVDVVIAAKKERKFRPFVPKKPGKGRTRKH
jgi:hypothetical protein